MIAEAAFEDGFGEELVVADDGESLVLADHGHGGARVVSSTGFHRDMDSTPAGLIS